MNAKKAYEQGLIYEQLGNYINAASEYIAAITYDRKLYEAYNRLGKILFYYQKHLEALHCFIYGNDQLETEACFKELNEIYPNDPHINDIKGDYYVSMGFKLKGLQYYYKALEAHQDVDFKLITYYKSVNVSQHQYYEEFDFDYINKAISTLGNNDYNEIL